MADPLSLLVRLEMWVAREGAHCHHPCYSGKTPTVGYLWWVLCGITANGDGASWPLARQLIAMESPDCTTRCPQADLQQIPCS